MVNINKSIFTLQLKKNHSLSFSLNLRTREEFRIYWLSKFSVCNHWRLSKSVNGLQLHNSAFTILKRGKINYSIFGWLVISFFRKWKTYYLKKVCRHQKYNEVFFIKQTRIETKKGKPKERIGYVLVKNNLFEFISQAFVIVFVFVAKK